MDKLEIEEILEGLSEGKFEPSYIINLLENKQLNDNDFKKIALSFDRDEDKISILKYASRPIAIIRTLKTEDSIVKAIGEITDDELKVKVALKFLTNDKDRLMAIEKIEDKDKALLIKILLSREEFKKCFLQEELKKYCEVGLDEGITYGIEIESLGQYSETILEAAKKNGQVIHKEMECGKLVTNRKSIMDNYGRR